MKKIGLILFIIIILISAYFIFFSHKGEKGETPPRSGKELEILLPLSPNFPPSPIQPEGEKIIISTPNGPVMIDNFLKNISDENGDMFYELFSTEQYAIGYYRKTNWFSIELVEPPFSPIRKQAEDTFLRILNIGKNDACKLDVSLGVSQSTDLLEGTNFSGIDFRLSFCPDGVAF